MHKSRAITLLEVLISIAIIAILASLIFPVFGNAKARAHETTCLSNLKQIYAAAQLYKADYSEFPSRTIANEEWTPYLSRSIVVGCPVSLEPMAYRQDMGDYRTMFNVDPKDADYARCKEVRQGDWPVVMDRNHERAAVGRVTGRRAVLLIRENGSAVVVNGNRMAEFRNHPESFPCPFLYDFYVNL